MKRVLSVVLQFILFLVVFLVGSLLPGANVLPTLSVGAGAGRVFVYDGVLLMFALYLLILLIAAARKRIHVAWPNSGSPPRRAGSDGGDRSPWAGSPRVPEA